MGEVTGIAWTDHTFNPWIGCTKVSPGCAHCYAAESLPVKFHGIQWGPGQPRHITSESNWKLPYRWAKAAAKAGVRRKVFCASLADVFEAEAPVEARRRLWAVIDETCYALDWQIVTKRPERIKSVMLDDGLLTWFFLSKRCWLLTTVENQEQTKRVAYILNVPAAIRGVSIEPMLGPVDLNERELLCKTWRHGFTIGTYLDWVICGGESGGGLHFKTRTARPMNPRWARSLRDQCAAAKVPFFFKQWGMWAPTEAKPIRGQYTGGGLFILDNGALGNQGDWWDGRAEGVELVGKVAAGSLLDGVDYKQFPEVRQ